MTSPYFAARLDETLTIDVEDDATEYVYSRMRGASAPGLAWYEFERTPRSWEEVRNATELRAYYRDDLGQTLPSSLAEDLNTVRLSFPQTGMRFEWTILEYEPPDPSDDWAGQPSRDFALVSLMPSAKTRGGENLPADDEEARVSFRDSTAPATRTLWCRKRDLTMRDQIRADAGDLFEAERDAMFLTRWRNWKPGDLFTFRGEQWQVRSTAEIGRRRAVELHARLCA